MTPRLAGKTAIVTGAARGQGAEHARRFVAEGARVVLGDVLADDLQAVGAELGDAAVCALHDVTDPGSWEEILALAVSAFGDPDVLVNNAGVLGGGSVAGIDVGEFRRTIDVNLLGPWLGIHVVGSHMAAHGGGSIINISSLAGVRATPNRGSYTASKWGLRGLTKSAAMELGPAGVRLNCILPGYIDTPMLAERRAQMVGEPELWDGLPLQRMGSPADIASMAVFLASDDSAYCTGTDFLVDGGAALGYFVPPLHA